MAEHSQPLVEGLITVALRNRRDYMPEIRWNRQVPRLARAVAKLLTEGPAKVGSRRKPDCEGDVDDLLPIGEIAEGSMGRQKTAPLNIMMDSTIQLEHLIKAGPRNAEFPT